MSSMNYIMNPHGRCPLCTSMDKKDDMVSCNRCMAQFHLCCVGIEDKPNKGYQWICAKCSEISALESKLAELNEVLSQQLSGDVKSTTSPQEISFEVEKLRLELMNVEGSTDSDVIEISEKLDKLVVNLGYLDKYSFNPFRYCNSTLLGCLIEKLPTDLNQKSWKFVAQFARNIRQPSVDIVPTLDVFNAWLKPHAEELKRMNALKQYLNRSYENLIDWNGAEDAQCTNEISENGKMDNGNSCVIEVDQNERPCRPPARCSIPDRYRAEHFESSNHEDLELSRVEPGKRFIDRDKLVPDREQEVSSELPEEQSITESEDLAVLFEQLQEDPVKPNCAIPSQHKKYDAYAANNLQKFGNKFSENEISSTESNTLESISIGKRGNKLRTISGSLKFKKSIVNGSDVFKMKRAKNAFKCHGINIAQKNLLIPGAQNHGAETYAPNYAFKSKYASDHNYEKIERDFMINEISITPNSRVVFDRGRADICDYLVQQKETTKLK
ncbi:uncharacterized protein LOC134224706 [Armigeres subalbatus]|uniref:uncharacterized protein LOC134224706 n=1 Tax=Armigeres subalbatus TaxID=124917 RepID=UPI002ED5CC32